MDQVTIRPKKKPSLLKRSISQINYPVVSDKPHIVSVESIQTNLERMFDILNRIKKRLLLIQEIGLAAQIDWMINTILKNKINDVNPIHNNDSVQFQQMLELLSEFSSEFNFKRNIEKLQSTFIKKRSNLNNTHIEFDSLCRKFDFILSKDFDIFDLCETIGRDNILLTVCGNIFYFFNVMKKIDGDKFANFIFDIKNGYKKSNHYHNVKIN